jgi:hypothetical protein
MATYIKISTIDVPSGGSATIDFTSIPSTYTDLLLKMSLRGVNANAYCYMSISFNGSTANQTQKQLESDGTTATSASLSNFQFISDGANNTTTTFGNHEMYIPNYASSNNKSASFDSVMEQNGTTAYMDLKAYLWSSTSAINQITITGITGNLAQFSSATLYGIKNS